MFERYNFGDRKPGERMAALGSVSTRPGHPEYAKDQLRGLCEVLVRNPGVHELLGSDLAVSVGIDKKKRTLMFVIGAA